MSGMRCEVLKEVNSKMMVFCAVTSRSVIGTNACKQSASSIFTV
jgi:hypothetical protein